MKMLYSLGNSKVDYISTPEARRDKPPQDDKLVMGLTLLTLPINATTINKVIALGQKRYATMDRIYLRKIDLTSGEVKASIVKMDFRNTQAELDFIKKNPRVSDDDLFKKLADLGFLNLTPMQISSPSKALKKELDDVPKRLASILDKKTPITKSSLHMGLPYFRVVVRKPLKVNACVSIRKVNTRTTEARTPIYQLL